MGHRGETRTGSRQVEKAILLGECKWGTDHIGRALLRELIEEKTPKVLAALPDQGKSWTVHYAFFTRVGLTEAAQAEAQQHQIQPVDLEQLSQDLQAADLEQSATGRT